MQDPNDLGLLKEEHLLAEQAGYFYTYLMNSSGKEVNFDDYKVTYIRPKVRAINHYYPLRQAQDDAYGLQIYGLDQLDKDYTYKYTGKELQTGDILDNNSTGLELYDIEARYYDPATGLWHVPDPAEQFHNPYLAMGNNPVVYVDPDGEFIGMAIFLGATINFMVQGMSGNINSAGDAALSLGIGAASAAAGAGIGAGISSVLAGGSFGCGLIGQGFTASSSFLSGAAIGAGAGAAGGFITGAGNTWAGGGSFQEGVRNGLISGGTGTVLSGITGGLTGGINAAKQDLNFFSGKPTLLQRNLPSIDIRPDGTSIGRLEVAHKINRFSGDGVLYNRLSDFTPAQQNWITDGGLIEYAVNPRTVITIGASLTLSGGLGFSFGGGLIVEYGNGMGVDFGKYISVGQAYGLDASLGANLTMYRGNLPGFSASDISRWGTSHNLGSYVDVSFGSSSLYNSTGLGFSIGSPAGYSYTRMFTRIKM